MSLEWVMKVMDKIWAKRKRMYSLGEQKSCGGDDRQMQGTKRKSILFIRTKSRHEYLDRKCTA